MSEEKTRLFVKNAYLIKNHTVKIKHSKYRNTGLIYELLVRQITADVLANTDSPAVKILKEFYAPKSPLASEYRLYDLAMKCTGLSREKAEATLQVITETSRKLNQQVLRRRKYELIERIGQHYSLEKFFSMQVRDYKPLAALYCLLEAQNSPEMVDPDFLVQNRVTLLEHITSKKTTKEVAKSSLVEEYSKFDKDLRLLTYKLMLTKFNARYDNLLPEQKNVLREFILSVESRQHLRTFLNQETTKIRKILEEGKIRVSDDITRIKLDEVIKLLRPLDNKEKVSDSHLIRVMQCYDLIEEIKK